MILHKRIIATHIKNNSLYSLIYNNIQHDLKAKHLSVDQIMQALDKNQEYLEDYQEINRNNELSNIHLKELSIRKQDSPEAQQLKRQINHHRELLKKMEKYSHLDNAYAIWVGSAAVMMIFMFHNLFSLYIRIYDSHPGIVYGIYVLIILGSFIFYKKMVQKHYKKHQTYVKMAHETEKFIQKGLEKSFFTEQELYIFDESI